MAHPFRIVSATAADYPTIRQIAHETWPVTFAHILSAEQIIYMLRMMYDVKALKKQVEQGVVFRLLLAPASDPVLGVPPYPGLSQQPFSPVGYVGFQPDYLPGTTKIHKLYLLPSTQGRGYGRALIDDVARTARQAGQQRLRLDVNYQNQALGFYEYLGFKKLKRHTTDIGQGFLMEDWIMEMPL